MSHAVKCWTCEQTVWPPVDAEGPGGQSEIAAHNIALDHVRETEHTDVRVVPGCYYVGDGKRPTSFDTEPTDPEDVAVGDVSQLAGAVAGAVRTLQDQADSLEEWENPDHAARHLRQYATAIESHLPDTTPVHESDWPWFECPECEFQTWLDGFDDATEVRGQGEYREVAHCGVCEFVVIRRI